MVTWKYTPQKSFGVSLAMRENSDGTVTVYVNGVFGGNLVTFRPDGTIYLHKNVNEDLGLQLDKDGRIVVKGDY